MKYADAGVNIAVADDVKQRIRHHASRTFTPGVLGGIGGFGALFALDRKKWKEPVLVSSADGVGTKLKVAMTRPPPTVECTPIVMATLSFLPAPSALETSTGSFHFFRSSAKSAPKLPMPPSTPGVNVRLAWWRILCLASSATAMFTPASAYFIERPVRFRF